MKRILITEVYNNDHNLLITQLVAANYSVRIIAPELNAGSPLLQLPVEIYTGNLLDEQTFISAAKGCDYIINTSLPAVFNSEIEPGQFDKITFLMNMFLKVTAKKVLHLQMLDAGKNLFSVIPNVNNPYMQAIRPVVSNASNAQQLIFSKTYALVNSILVVFAAQQVFNLENANRSYVGISQLTTLLEEEDSQNQVYLVSNNTGKVPDKKPYVPVMAKWNDLVRNAGLFIKVELWKSLVYAYL
ncbi:MAG: hypothetical protein V4717_21690 [Bacteroidota bacterium]